MQPERGNNGRYALCVGTARRGLPPHSPNGATPIFGETNAFWELRPGTSPSELAVSSRQTAQHDVQRAQESLAQLNDADPAFTCLQILLGSAQYELINGEASYAAAQTSNEVETWAKAIRAYTRAQVRDRQVRQALSPITDTSL